MSVSRGTVAAGHPRTAEVGATVLREGGNAVDAARAAVLASWVCEPLLTGPGAGGYLLVAGAGTEPVLLDFFVAAPGAGADPGAHAELVPIEVDFGDARQVFNCGAASCGVPGSPAGLAGAAARWGSLPLADLCAPAARLAREGVALNAEQAFVFEILRPILLHTPEARATYAPAGRPLRTGERFADPELAETIARAAYRGRQVLTNPPPSAGGILLALAFDRLEQRCPDTPPTAADVVSVMEEVQELRTSEFLDGLPEPGFLERFLSSHLGSTTHIAAVDADGLACSVTCSNGACSGVLVPGTGIHLNNIMGETDLNPHGFFREPPGRRMPSMMAPTVVLGADGEVELALGSAGSNRIRSAILQVVVGALDHGLDAGAAIRAPRVHAEDGTVYAEPGVELGPLEAAGREIVRFRAPNLFFGGAQAVERAVDGRLSGGGDPRRGGAAVAA
ncbi:MAG: gamma-glutamyltransferase family protein [Solirubrobacteraceae bacterium]|nr:gamma-glutamyltransferase family protein [Solirubrobacteraceae bacterium]